MGISDLLSLKLSLERDDGSKSQPFSRDIILVKSSNLAAIRDPFASCFEAFSDETHQLLKLSAADAAEFVQKRPVFWPRKFMQSLQLVRSGHVDGH